MYGVLAIKPADENQLYVNGQTYLGKVFSSLRNVGFSESFILTMQLKKSS
jgi:hypothetical protein